MLQVGTLRERDFTKYEVLFGKFQGVIEVKQSPLKCSGRGMCMAHAKHNFEICKQKIEREYIFLQY